MKQDDLFSEGFRVSFDEIEDMAAAVHNAYLETCDRLEWPVKEENRRAYHILSEDSKELDRASVRAVLKYLGVEEIK